MKKSQKTVLTGMLALLTAAGVLASCGESGTPAQDTAPATEPTAVTEETADPNDRSFIKDNLPDDLDFGGKTFAFLCTSVSKNEKDYAGPAEQTGEIVEDAVLARNASVADRLNIKFQYDAQELDGSTAPDTIKKLVMAGDSSYDAFIAIQWGITKIVTDNCLYNVNDLKYLDFSQPWWNNFYMDELTISKDCRFFLVGDFDLDMLEWARALFYNKVMYANYFDEGDGLYREVLDGKWTIDRMAELCKAVYIDYNNDAKYDIDDQLGFITYGTMSSADAFVYATDLSFSQRTPDGLVELALMNERAVTLAEKINNLFWQSGTYSNLNISSSDEMASAFKSGRVLFLGNSSLGTAKSLRDMKDDFGFLPFPKFDESQEGYRALVHDAVLLSCVSAASENTDIAGAVFEALNAETYRSVTPVWYETALKVKYSRDEISTEMIDLIHDSITTNFLFAYNYALNNAGLLFRELITKNSTDYASLVKKNEKGAQKAMDKLVAAFTENAQ